MRDGPRRTRIRIELTEGQREQIQKATGRKVNALELGLQGLPEPAEGPEEAADPDVSERG